MPPLTNTNLWRGKVVEDQSAQDLAARSREDRTYGLAFAQTRRRADYHFEDEAKLMALGFRALAEIHGIINSIPLRVWLEKRRWRFLAEAAATARWEFDELWYSLATEGLGNVLVPYTRACWSNRHQFLNDTKAMVNPWFKKRTDLMWRAVQWVRPLWKGSSTLDTTVSIKKPAQVEKSALVKCRRQLAYRAARPRLNRVVNVATSYWKDAMEDAETDMQAAVDPARLKVRVPLRSC